MKLSAVDVIQLGRHARLSLSIDEVERFRVQLNSILEQLAALEAVAEADRDVVLHDGGTAARLRADEPDPGRSQHSLDALSADFTAGFFTVPRVLPSTGQSA